MKAKVLRLGQTACAESSLPSLYHQFSPVPISLGKIAARQQPTEVKVEGDDLFVAIAGFLLLQEALQGDD